MLIIERKALKEVIVLMLNNKITPDISFIYQKNPTLSILLILLVVITLLLSLLIPGKIFTLGNFQSIAFQLPELGIIAIAMMITMLSGGINLSIISTANISGIITASILTNLITENTGNPLPIIIMAIAAGWGVSLLIGILNGFVIAYIGVSPILATLGMMTLLEGVNILTTKGYVISGLPCEVLYLGNGILFGIPVPLIIFLIIALIISILLNKTPFGISNYLIGSNKIATSFSGINVKLVLLKTYAISGLLCGIFSTIIIARFNSARAGYAASYLLITILASVLGGVNPNGGFGKVSGLVTSLIILQVISSGLNLMGVSAYLTKVLWGAMLLLVIGFRSINSKILQ